MRPLFLFVIIPLLGLGIHADASMAGPAARGVREDAGDSRYRYADDRIWARRRLIQELEQAALRAPRDLSVLDRLGEAYYQARFMHLARTAFERALAVDSRDANAYFGLGRICLREGLDTPGSDAFNQAERYFEHAVHTRPQFSEAWVALASLRFERRDPWTAREAAMNALATAPPIVEAELSAAYLSYRTGMIALSDSLFAVAIPRCPPGIAARFSDIRPLLTWGEQMDFGEWSPPQRAEFARRFWSRNDPDPTTPQNEARLEFWSRLAHALLLIGDPWSPRWLGRTDLYSRFGRRVHLEGGVDSQQREMPFVGWGEIPVDPTAEALHQLGLNTVGDNRAVFAPLPPGKTVRPLESLVSRFEGAGGVRLTIMLETPGTPADSISADCVVIGANEREIARASRALAPSACDPAEHCSGEFTFELPPAHYRLAFAVRDLVGGQGVASVDLDVPLASSKLAVSDLVLVCDLSGATPRGVALNPNLSARVSGEQSLFAYFEVYHLSQQAGGGNHFAYEYTVRESSSDSFPAAEHRRDQTRVPPRLSYGTEQEGVGSLRRQFIRVPAASLPGGRYRLTITAHDRLSGAKAERSVDFVKVEAEQ
jgi:hypothetical protein